MEFAISHREPGHHHVGVTDGLHLQIQSKETNEPDSHHRDAFISQLNLKMIHTHLIDVKVINYGIKACVEVVEQRNNL